MIGYFPPLLRDWRRREATGQDNYHKVDGILDGGGYLTLLHDFSKIYFVPEIYRGRDGCDRAMVASYDYEEIGQLLGGN